MVNYLINKLLYCLILTIAIETTIGILIGIRNKKDIVLIILVNVLTNPIVVMLPLFISALTKPIFGTITTYLLEVITVFIEGNIYKRYMIFEDSNKYLISLILNLSSYIIGLFLIRLI